MSQKKETILQNKIQQDILNRFPTVFIYKVHGNMYQKSGIPDLSMIVDGIPIYIEVKWGKGKPSPLQLQVMEEIRRAGGYAATCWSVAEANTFINDVLIKEKRGHMKKTKKQTLVLPGKENFLEQLESMDLESAKKGDLTKLASEIKEAYKEVDALVRTRVLKDFMPLLDEIASRDAATKEQKDLQIKNATECLAKYEAKHKLKGINRKAFFDKYRTTNKLSDDKLNQITSTGVAEIKAQLVMLKKTGATKESMRTYLETLNLDAVTILPTFSLQFFNMSVAKREALLDYLTKNEYSFNFNSKE